MSKTSPSKPVVNRVEPVTVVGYDDQAEYAARLDTGAKRTCIGTAVANEVGTKGPIETKAIRTSNGDTDERDIYEFAVELDGNVHLVRAGVCDRERMTYPVRLGRDVIADYLIDPGRTADD